MYEYIGTKIIKAEPCDYFKFYIDKYGKNSFENMIKITKRNNDFGYRVSYSPDNYISWSPKKPFEDAYQLTNDMDFSKAFHCLLIGLKVAADYWEGDYIYYDQDTKSIKKVLKGSSNNLSISYVPLDRDMFESKWKIISENKGGLENE